MRSGASPGRPGPRVVELLLFVTGLAGMSVSLSLCISLICSLVLSTTVLYTIYYIIVKYKLPKSNGVGTKDKLKMGEKRSYSQYCTVARALDVVGERWTLLLVRELSRSEERRV